MRTGGDDFLTKPVDPSSLLRAISLRAGRFRLLNAYMVRDALTGLLNHNRIKEMLSNEVARARRSNAPLAIALLNLDQIKPYNQAYGYLTVDRVIKSLAHLLRERLRDSDLIGRLGCEEFLLILPNCEQTQARQLVEDIRRRFVRVRQIGDTPNSVFTATFSAGLAAFPLSANPEQLLQAAGSALSSAKRGGGNRTG